MNCKTNYMRRLMLALPMVAVTFSMMAQEGENLVENPGFEDAKNRKIRRLGDMKRAEGWVSSTGNRADLFSGDAKMPDVMTPDNVYGMEEPREGINYGGIISYSYREKEDRTYITSKLKSPLKKGMRYKVKFYASRAELAKYSANRLGAHFSKRAPGTDEKVPALILETHVEHPNKELFDGDYGWDFVCGEYTAEGNEKYITLGNFTSDNDVKSERNRKPRGIRGKQIIAAYYYIDDISVQLLGPNERCDCNYADEAQIETSTVYQRSPQITDEMSVAEKMKEFSIFYARGRYDVKKDGDKTLDKIAKLMKDNPAAKVKLIGHMDSKESMNPAQQDVSKKRAEHIRSLMVNKDVAADRFTIEDARDGEEAPYVKEDDDEKVKAAKNRRVSFELVQ